MWGGGVWGGPPPGKFSKINPYFLQSEAFYGVFILQKKYKNSTLEKNLVKLSQIDEKKVQKKYKA